MLKMIFRNLNPWMASQLRGRVSTIDELVRLRQQLEKDKGNQLQYEQRKKQNWKPIGKEKADTPAAHPSADSLPRPSNTPTVIWRLWRCKGSHAPCSCPSYNLNSRSKSANNPNLRQPNHSQPHCYIPLKV